MRTIALLALTLGASALGCGESETETSYVDVGTACISGEPDASHTVTVDFETCLSSSCDTLLESTCSAELVGNELKITAEATVLSKTSGPCTLDCGRAEATCETPPLPAGDYELVYGESTRTVSVPADPGEPACGTF